MKQLILYKNKLAIEMQKKKNNIVNLMCLKLHINFSLHSYQLMILKQNEVYINFYILKNKKVNTNLKIKGYNYIYPYWTFFFNNQLNLIKIRKNLLNTTLVIDVTIEKKYKLKKIFFSGSPLINYILNQKNKKTLKIINTVKWL